MKWSVFDHECMARAIQIAKHGQYSCQPNPKVGCVIVKENKIIGEGAHIKAGKGHAEIIALKKAGIHAKGSSCYVTLEPCVHTGRTSPCTDTLIDSGVNTVYVAMVDPNPKVNGKGLETLNQSGIRTHVGLLENEARLLNKGFIKRMEEEKPYVNCKLAISLDGKTSLSSGISKWISGKEARKDVQKLRAKSCAILTGIGTIIADDPMLNIRNVDTLDRQPIRVIVDRKLEIPHNAKVFEEHGDIIIFTNSDNKKRAELLTQKNLRIIAFDKTHDFLDSCLKFLALKEEVNEVLVEAGPKLVGALVNAGLVDQLVLYQAPIIFGDKAADLFKLPEIKNMDDKIEMNLLDVRHVGKDLRLTYNFKN